ncbi:uncharacterized protein KY384_006043 [Bacidia gigantensis]|uniref:uncharacterized protein n=1 Tax=Bacidia gigantensis TaxID=2732470 RepID=UPI001D04112B|nr:uncharacterized protein KY384_006043 [Bacidia gigantensis]KAG8529406.1 hypothetical protein KY384_006043 [Bacidia gigantensis]
MAICPPTAKQLKELHAEDVVVLGKADESYKTFPIQKKYHSPEFLRTIPHLRLRTPLNAVLARLRSEADYSLSSFFRQKQFIRVQTPIITSSDCEGAGEVFEVTEHAKEADDVRDVDSHKSIDRFFKSRKHLTVSSQLHLEAFINDHPRVWTLSPTFRAENSDTPRHLSEFWMLEAEMRTECLNDVMEFTERMLKTLVTDLLETSILDDLKGVTNKASRSREDNKTTDLGARWGRLAQQSWPRIRYADAVNLLQNAARTREAHFEYEPSWAGLYLEHEKWIAGKLGMGGPVFVTDFPGAIKPFYMLPSVDSNQPSNMSTAACFDLLLPESGEVVGGSLREHRLDALLSAMQSYGVNAPTSPGSGNLDWYVDLRRNSIYYALWSQDHMQHVFDIRLIDIPPVRVAVCSQEGPREEKARAMG